MKSRGIAILLSAICLSDSGAETFRIESPDKQLHVQAGLDPSGAFRYSFEAFGKPLILPSSAAIQAGAETIPGAGWKLIRQQSSATLVAEVARTLITFSGAAIIPDIPGFYQKNRETLRAAKRRVTASDNLSIRLAPGVGACFLLEQP